MGKIFKGRPILPANLDGVALVSHTGFNTLACFFQSILTEAETAICSDQDNPEIFGKILTNRIVCIPKSIGSTSAGATWDCVAKRNIAPKAMLFSKRIDSLSAAGMILAEIWAGRRICTVDYLGDEFLQCVKTGQLIEILDDGTVSIK